jgi:hypothetical protein
MAAPGPKMENPLGLPYETRVIYSRARSQAKYRREEWAFTLESWWEMWQDSGVWEHRGPAPHQYVMVRKDNIEAWGPHNCIIVSRRLQLKKHAYELLHKYGPPTDWDERFDVRNRK